MIWLVVELRAVRAPRVPPVDRWRVDVRVPDERLRDALRLLVERRDERPREAVALEPPRELLRVPCDERPPVFLRLAVLGAIRSPFSRLSMPDSQANLNKFSLSDLLQLLQRPR